MRPADTVELLTTLAIDVREFVAQAIEPISAKQAELEQRVALIPTERAEPGAAGASAYDLARAAGFAGTETEWLATLRGQDGTSVTVEDVQPMVRNLVDAAASQIPVPKDGASISLDDVRPLIEEAAAALSLPKALSADDVRPLVKELVDAAAAAMPVPKDGASVGIEDLRPLVSDLVDLAVASIEPAQNGKDGTSVTLDDVRPLIEQAVTAAMPQHEPAEVVLHNFASAVIAKFASADHAG